jgi:hypothetical protein
MYIEKIIENAIADNIERKLNILIINQYEDDYIKNLCNNSNHNFYLFKSLEGGPQWFNPQIKPYNLNFITDLNNLKCKFIDLVLTFRRNESYDIGRKISNQLNINLISIDDCSSISVGRKLFGTPNEFSKQESIKKHGLVNVHTNELIMNSWMYGQESINMIIPNLIPEKIDVKNPSSIFVDPKIPDIYLSRIGLNKEFITKDINKAKVYLHLFNNIDHLLLTCMRSSIPVIIPNLTKEECFDLEYLLKNAIIIGLPNDLPKVIVAHQTCDAIYHLAVEKNVIKNAENFVDNYCCGQEKFKTSWENIFRYASETNYIRGY